MLGTTFEWLAALCLGLAVLGWVLYPLALAIFSHAEDADESSSKSPGVSVIVATREAPCAVRERVANLLMADYPPGQLQVVVALDASVADGFEEYVRALGGLAELTTGDLPEGKASALNAGVRAARNDILIFADSMQVFAPDAIRRLTGALSSGKYSAVGGELVTGTGASRSSIVSLFWSYELWIRRREAALHSVIGVTGAIYAMRRSLWRPVPAGVLCDDVAVPMNLVLGGHRVGHCSGAIAFDTRQFTPMQEYRRKVRTQTGNLQLCVLDPRLLSPRRNPVWIQFVCHKLLRIATPVLLLLAVPGLMIWVTGLVDRLSRVTLLTAIVLLGAIAVVLVLGTRGRIFRQVMTALLLLSAPLAAIYFAAIRDWEVWSPAAAQRGPKIPTPRTKASP